jgi:hypothetical protein
MKNLREESYYQDLYDHLVVDDCRMLEETMAKVPPEKVGKMLVRNNL